MSEIEVFETTKNKTNLWLKDVMEELELTDKKKAYSALRGTLHILRDRLMVEESVNFAAQLPMLLRGLYFEGWRPTHVPLSVRKKADFVHLFDGKLADTFAMEPEEVIRRVFGVIKKHVSEGEIEDIRRSFPEDLRDLWE